MKQILYSLFILLFFSCKSQDQLIFIPVEYQYPIDSLTRTKTFIYQNPITNEKEFTDLSKNTKSNREYLCTTRYTSNEVFDSTISLNNKNIEIYSLDPFTQKLSKVEIIKDTVLNNSTKFGQKIRNLALKNSNYNTSQTYNAEYLKDTVITWNGKRYDCIVMKGILKTDFTSNLNNDKGQALSTHYAYFAKHIGLIKYTTISEKFNYTFNLLDIVAKK